MTLTVLGGTVLTMALAASAFGQKQKVKSKDVPVPVLAAASKSYPKAQLKGWEKEIKDERRSMRWPS